MSEYQFFLASRHADILTASTGKDDLLSPAGGAISGYNANATAILAATSTKDQGGLLPKQGSGRVENQLVAHLAQGTHVKTLTAQMSRQSHAISDQETTLSAAREAINALPQSGRQTDQQLAHKIAAIQASPTDKVTGLPKMQFLTDGKALKVASTSASPGPSLQREDTLSPTEDANNDARRLGVANAANPQKDDANQKASYLMRSYSTSKDVAQIFPEILGWRASEATVQDFQNRMASGVAYDTIRRETAFSQEAHDRAARIFPEILGWEASEATVQDFQNRMASGVTYDTIRRETAFSQESHDRVARIFPEILGWRASEATVQDFQNRMASGVTYDTIRRETAFSQESYDRVQNAAQRVLGRAPTRTEISSYQTELANGKSLNDLSNNHFATAVSSIFSDPSLDGPNLAMNTQGVANGQIQYSDKHSTLDGGSSPDWGVIQWRGQSALNPEAGTSSQVWDKKYGNSIGHWTQGSANSMAGKTDYNVFRDPKSGHYVYQMAAQGGNLLDVQLSTLGSVDNQYSFNHQITTSFNQGISDYHGSTGSYQAGINFTINYHSNNLNFGIFLQFVSIDSVGQPRAYVSLPKSLGGSIYNVSGSQTAYINPTLPSNDGAMYSTTINLNQGLMASIKAIVGLYPQYSEIENLNNWYLNGSYIGVESTSGTGSSSDVTGKYNVGDLKITYDKSKNVSYSDQSSTAPIMSMQKVA